jgi:hypothetical protein
MTGNYSKKRPQRVLRALFWAEAGTYFLRYWAFRYASTGVVMSRFFSP